MTTVRHCPECGTALKPKASGCACGWKAAAKIGGDGAAFTNRDRFRCAWLSNGERCRYGGAFCPSTTDSSDFYCLGHSRCLNNLDGATGQRIVEESIETYKQCPDYSAAAVYARSKEAYLNRPFPPYPPLPEGVRTRIETVAPVIGAKRVDLFQPVGKIAAAHVRQTDVDRDFEAESERAAMQDEGIE